MIHGSFTCNKKKKFEFPLETFSEINQKTNEEVKLFVAFSSVSFSDKLHHYN